MVKNGNDTGHRRRVPRQEVQWRGTCRIDGDPPVTDECDVVDISMIGVGVILEGPIPSDLVDRTMTVEVQASEAASVSLRLTGEIRYVVPSPRGGFRIGAQFSGLSETERSILDTFEQMRLAW